MPTYIDVIKFEEEAPANTIRLVKSGEFYRAYNHSAWLFQCCITEHKVMRKYIKSLKTYIYYIIVLSPTWQYIPIFLFTRHHILFCWK